jgi:hypothetical protein
MGYRPQKNLKQKEVSAEAYWKSDRRPNGKADEGAGTMTYDQYN